VSGESVRARGFTLIELLVVMVIIATLLSIVTPRYFRHLDRASEAALRQTLNVVRDAIDKYHADKGRYPPTIEQLVEQRYLRQVPTDPVADKGTAWILLPPQDDPNGGIRDVHSGATGSGSDGIAYSDY
jgi:type II secretion system protein G